MVASARIASPLSAASPPVLTVAGAILVASSHAATVQPAVAAPASASVVADAPALAPDSGHRPSEAGALARASAGALAHALAFARAAGLARAVALPRAHTGVPPTVAAAAAGDVRPGRAAGPTSATDPALATEGCAGRARGRAAPTTLPPAVSAGTARTAAATRRWSCLG